MLTFLWYTVLTNEEMTTESQRYNCFTRNGGNAIPKHAGPEAKGSNPTTGLTLLWARDPFRGSFNHWQVSWKEAGKKVPLKQENFFEVRLLNDESIRWLYIQRVKLHLNKTKGNETDIEKEWTNLQNIIKSAANESLGTVKRRNRRKYLKIWDNQN